MARSQARKPPTRTARGILRVALVLLVAVVVVDGLPLTARAALWSGGGGGGGNSTGNGRHNRNSISINSPEFNRGIQHITNTNVGGGNNTQASFCQKRFRHCRISQRQFADP
jgi:hypothetical protein